MCFYDVIVALMNIHEIKCKISKQAISVTSDNNLVRFSAINAFLQGLFHIHKIKTFRYSKNMKEQVEQKSLKQNLLHCILGLGKLKHRNLQKSHGEIKMLKH